MPVRVFPDSKITCGEVNVPVSKSEDSRISFIRSLANLTDDTQGTDAADTLQLKQLLTSDELTLDATDGGSTARFMMAWCVVRQREAILTGTERLKQRPVADSVDLLRQIGADITYLDKEGFLPVHIKPASLKQVNVLYADGSRTSQHISAMMMIAPLLGYDVSIKLSNNLVSFPYLQLTASIMNAFHVPVKISSEEIFIPKTSYAASSITAGGDWSAASYFYEIAALSQKSEIVVHNMDAASVQGDKIVIEYFKPFGVETIFENNKIIISKKQPVQPEYYSQHFRHCPDLTLSLAATCGGLNCKADLFELQGLLIKECDRVAAFQREGYKLNIKTDFCGGSKLKILEESLIKHSIRVLKSYNDHRVIMSFAPLSLITGEVFLEETDSVKKSFPDYFHQLNALGIKSSVQ